MTLHEPAPAVPTAAWISRFANDLLSTRPGLRPLDAVRLAMDASAAGRAGDDRLPPSRPPANPGTGTR